MEQNPNNQNNNQQRQKQGIQNTNRRLDNRPVERNKQVPHGGNSSTDDNNIIKTQQGNKERPSNQDRIKGRDNAKYATKNRDQKATEKVSRDIKPTVNSNQNRPYRPDSGFSSGVNTRYGRNASKNSRRNDILGRSITAKRIETVEDIQADIERIDKDIQFEIKQIKAVKLGL